MRGGLRIGRLFGIDIVIDWSWAFIFLLVAWNLTAAFSRWHPDWTLGGSFALAVAAALLFFGSVLAHELAHSLVGRRFGLRVTEIRLFLFGGVANIDREPPSAAAEFWTAIVGPLVSIAIGVLVTIAASATMPGQVNPEDPWATLARVGPATTLLSWLGPINVIVGVFNLIPGYPLDGGRLLRALLWRVTGDLHKATLTSALVGRATGWGFILLGVAMIFGLRVPFFGTGVVSGIWLGFIGWFLSSAAERSYGALLIQDVLQGVRVSTLMRHTGWTVTAQTSVAALVEDWFMRSSERGLAVVDEGRLVGIVSVADIRKIPQEAWRTTPVTAIMTPRDRLVVAAPNDDATSALRKFAEHDVDQVPVLDGEYLVGMLGRAEIARWLELHLGGGQPGFRTPRPV